MNNLQKYSTTWVNLTTMLLSKRNRAHENVNFLCESMCIEEKSRQNWSMLLEVRLVVTLGWDTECHRGMSKNSSTGTLWGLHFSGCKKTTKMVFLKVILSGRIEAKPRSAEWQRTIHSILMPSESRNGWNRNHHNNSVHARWASRARPLSLMLYHLISLRSSQQPCEWAIRVPSSQMGRSRLGKWTKGSSVTWLGMGGFWHSNQAGLSTKSG